MAPTDQDTDVAALLREATAHGRWQLDPAAIGGDSHRAQLADFLDAIERDRQPAVSGEDARRPLEVILGVYESARTGREVTLPLGRSEGSR